MARACARCGKPARFRSPVCASCKPMLDELSERLRPWVDHVLVTVGPFSAAWDQLAGEVGRSGFPPSLATHATEAARLNWLSRYTAFAMSDGVVSAEERAGVYAAAHRLWIDPAAVRHLTGPLERTYALTEVRAGRLPQVTTPDLHLPIGVSCHLDVFSTRWRALKSGPAATSGRLIFTNKGVTFAATSHGGEATWNRIVRVDIRWPDNLVIESSTSRLAGEFTVPDCEWAAEIASTLLRVDRRQLVTGAGRTPIPQHVKGEVWRRDGGRCVQCGLDGSGGASLEFDHIIPVALGGATSPANLQVLCRRCNNLKGARI
jgi:5-methylcytosine-specific restriction endonuclease McrA